MLTIKQNSAGGFEYSGSLDFSTVTGTRTIEQIIVDQTPTTDGWVCPKCENYGGGLRCKVGVFISYSQANMSGCQYFKNGHEVCCPHCNGIFEVEK